MVQYLVKKGAKPRQASWIADTSTLAQAARSTEMIEYILFDGEREPENSVYDRDAVVATLKGSGAMQAAAVGNGVDVYVHCHGGARTPTRFRAWTWSGDVRECDNGPALHKIFRQMGLGFGSLEAQERHDRDMQKVFRHDRFLARQRCRSEYQGRKRSDCMDACGSGGSGNKARLGRDIKAVRPAEAEAEADGEA
jgi:hypothetical protein